MLDIKLPELILMPEGHLQWMVITFKWANCANHFACISSEQSCLILCRGAGSAASTAPRKHKFIISSILAVNLPLDPHSSWSN